MGRDKGISTSVVLGKTPNKKVQVCTDEDRLRLRWSFALGQRTSMNLGLKDLPENRTRAFELAEVIECDLLGHRYDVSKKKYKNLIGKGLSKEEMLEEIAEGCYYAELILRFAKYKLKIGQITEATYKKYYMKMYRWLNANCIGLDEVGIFNLIVETKEVYTGNYFVEYLNSACSWALMQGIATENPFARLEYPKAKKKKINVIHKKDCFTKEDRYKIIKAFDEDDYFSYYTDFVRFLFFSGCRPNEATALRKDKITPNGILFDFSVSDTFEGLRITKGTKTEQNRFFPMNSQLQEVVDRARKKVDPWNRGLLFPPPLDGKFINASNFRKRAWYPMLKVAGVPKRVPYTTRHTFITMCLEAGMDLGILAYRCGTSRKIIEQRYANFSKSEAETPII